MPFEITSSVEPRMLVLRAHGIGTTAEGHRAFRDVQAHDAYCQGIPILIDVVDLKYGPSTAETRVFAGLFATAFPCSQLALVGRRGKSHEAAKDVARVSVNRGATVAAFTGRLEAMAWLTEQPLATPAPVTEVAPPREWSLPQRLSDWVAIPYTLREKIETTRVDVDGHACPLRLDSAAGRPVIDPEVAEVTVSTEYAGSARLARVDVRVCNMDDEDYVVSTIVSAMKAVLAGAQAGLHVTASAVPR